MVCMVCIVVCVRLYTASVSESTSIGLRSGLQEEYRYLVVVVVVKIMT